jgi:hypothetical protein
VRYPGYEDTYYEDDDCVGFYGEEGYGQFLYEMCSGDTRQDLGAIGVSSVKLGRNVHVNLYSDPDFGAGSTCGGLVERLAFSSPSLSAMSAHHGTLTIDDEARAASVYNPQDRSAYGHFEGSFDFYGSGDLPFCSSLDGEALTIQRDGATWASSAATRALALAPPYAIEFEYRSHHPADGNHADGLTVFFQKDVNAYQSTEPPRENLGFIADGTGYGVVFNIYNNQVSIRDGNFSTLSSTGEDTFTDGEWVPVRIEVETDRITAYYAGAELVSTNVQVSNSHNGFGFSVGTGAYSAEFSVRDVQVTAL